MKIFLRKPYLLALLISATLAAWLWSGQMAESTTPEPLPTAAPPPAPSIIQVRVREQQAQPLTREIIITGRTAPLRTATLRAEIDGRVEEIGAQRGARVKTDDLIVRLATEERALRLQEAQALVKQREFEYQSKQNLSRKGYQSQVQMAEALTLLESAKTLVEQAQIALKNTVIRAPFAGVLVQRLVEQGDFVSRADVIAEVMDEDPFLIVGEVTELQRPLLKLGNEAVARLVTGQTITGKIRLISAQADAATRTFHIEIEVPNPQGLLAAGITSEIRLPLETVFAHKISAALLSLNDEGVLGIKTVGDDNRVAFYPAHFVQAAAESIWLGDLPKQLRLITVGQGFVRLGDLVEPVLE